MPLHKKIRDIIEQTNDANLPPLKDQPLKLIRDAFFKMRILQGEGCALPKVESLSIPSVGGEILLRLYYPHLKDNLPVALYFHGGGYVKGSVESSDALCRNLCAQSGVVIASCGFRLAPEYQFPAPIDDGELAVRYLMKNGPQLGLNPAYMALIGDSSGGHLVASVIKRLAKANLLPKLQVLVTPILDYTCSLPSHEEFAKGYLLEEESLSFYRDQFVPKDHPLDDPNLSPYLQESLDGLPDTLIITAEYDPVRDEGEMYGQKLLKAGVATTLHRYEGVTHGFFQMGGVLEEGRLAIKEVAKKLQETLH